MELELSPAPFRKVEILSGLYFLLSTFPNGAQTLSGSVQENRNSLGAVLSTSYFPERSPSSLGLRSQKVDILSGLYFLISTFYFPERSTNSLGLRSGK